MVIQINFEREREREREENNILLFYSPGQIVKLLIALAILFTYGLQLFVPLDIILKGVKGRCGYKYQTTVETLVRVGLALCTSKLPWFSTRKLRNFLNWKI